MKMTSRLILTLLALAFPLIQAFPADIPIVIELDKPQLVTLVIENAEGVRVRNLVAEMLLPAGRNRLSWDGYDDGVLNAKGDLLRKRVAPGSYLARGLTHDGLTLTYEFTAYSGGNPPWPTQDRTGAWLADHSVSLGALYLPAGSASPYGDGAPQVLLSSLVAEAGAPLVWVGTDGATLQRRSLWGWHGALALARDAGGKAAPDIYAYLVMGWEDRLAIRGLKSNGTGTELLTFPLEKKGAREPGFSGHSLAVHDGLLVFNVPTEETLVFVDVASRKILAKLPMPTPRGLHFDKNGQLLVISDGKVLRYRVRLPSTQADGTLVPLALEDRRELIATGLENPRALAFDPTGSELFVSNWGKSHQIKVYTPEGRPLRVIGKPGVGRQLGLYDELKMQNPLGMAIDEKGQLWVAEASHLPKRISLWNAKTGAFLRAHYGPPAYGGGGTIDPNDKTRMFYKDYFGLIEFALDWETGTSKPKAILVDGGSGGTSVVDKYGIEYGKAENGEPSRWGFVGERPVTVGGRTYILNFWQAGLRDNAPGVTWLLEDGHTARPVSRVGGTSFSWPPPLNASFREAKGERKGPALLTAWTDRNGNSKIEVNEWEIRDMPGTWIDAEGKERKVSGLVQEIVHDDLSVTTNWGLYVPPPVIDDQGVPHYDLSKAEYLLPQDPMFYYDEQRNWGLPVMPIPDGWVVAGFSGWRDRRKLWTYPNAGTGVATRPGELVHPTRLLGPPAKAATGEAGHWMAWNGEKGNMYLLTSDGLFLQTLGGDMRTTPLLRFPKAERGMVIDQPGARVSFEDEHFRPTITTTKDGEVYLVAGKEHSSIFRVDGFASVQRKEFASFVLSATELASMPEAITIPARTQGSSLYGVEIAQGAPQVDGIVTEFNTWLPIGYGPGSGQGAIRISGDHLHAAWRTGDAKALNNGGGDFRFLFKQGGAVDFMLRSSPATGGDPKAPRAGDLRVLVTTDKGVPRAVLFQQIAPNSPASEKVLYDSPIDSFTMERVVEITPHLKFAMREGDVEISLPLSVLGLQVKAGDKTLGDMGILRGDGLQTLQRIYWQNQNTLNVSDIPSEAKLQPANWGTFEFRPNLPPLPSLVPAAKPVNAAPGLATMEFKGQWEALPDFRSLTPASRASAPVPTLEGVTTGKSNFALVFGGFLQIPADGEWTLILNSNDGSALYMAGVKVIDNDGIHWSRDESRTLSLKAGSYPIRIEYFQRDGGQKLEMRWKGPGTEDQVIPPAAFWHPSP